MIEKMDVPALPARIAIAGPTGSGKSTLGRRIAAATGAVHIELDALFHGPNWTPAETPAFRAAVADAVARPRWVSDGNYRAIRDLTWGSADVVIWLDYPLPLILARLTRRTLGRWWNDEELWNGNREELRTHLFTRESLFYWAVTTHYRHRRTYPAEFARCGAPWVVRIRRPRALEAYLVAHGL